MGLFGGTDLHISVLTDYAKRDKRKIETIIERKILEDGHFLTFASILAQEEADVEDLFAPELYAEMLNKAYEIPTKFKLSGKKLMDADTNTGRLVKKAEAAMRLVGTDVEEFHHYGPAGWLVRNQSILDSDDKMISDTLDRAEKVIVEVNKLL